MNRSIRLERVYPHPRDSVWRAITDGRAMATWLMENDFEPVVGRAFTFKTRPRRGFDGIVHCEVTELEAPRRLAFTWRGGPGGGEARTLDTVVRFTLEAIDERSTRLVLEHAGFAGMKAVLISFMLEPGWKKMMKGRLALAIEALAKGEAPAKGVASKGVEAAASKL
jgi:uncharacterized protein YndB with AHSA1/START domain